MSTEGGIGRTYGKNSSLLSQVTDQLEIHYIRQIGYFQQSKFNFEVKWLAFLTSDHEIQVDHEIFSTVILSLPLIQEGQSSVSGERMCTVLVNRLED